MIKIDYDSNDEGGDIGPDEAMGGAVSLIIIIMVILLILIG